MNFNLLVKMNAQTQQDISIWRKKYAELEDKYKAKEVEYKKLVNEKEERKLKESNLNVFNVMLRKGEVQLEWDEAIFNFTLEKAIVHKDKSITFKFYSGYETPYLLKNSNIFTFVNCYDVTSCQE